MSKYFLVLFILIIPSSSLSQIVQKMLDSQVNYKDIIFECLERSYILPFGGDANAFIDNKSIRVDGYRYEDVLLEGNIVPAYSMHNLDRSNAKCRKLSKLGSNYMIFVPKIVLRMYLNDSAPVRTPSFMPRITFYYWKRGRPKYAVFKYVTFMISHFSNGSVGEFFKPDMTINNHDGSFSTNFVEIAYNRTSYIDSDRSDKVWINMLKIGFETHLRTINTSQEMRKKPFKYGFNRVNLTYRYTREIGNKLYEVTPKVTWIADRVLGHESIFTRENFITSLTVSFSFKRWEDMRFFANIYRGPDYYNINYFKFREFILRAGISTNPSNLLK